MSQEQILKDFVTWLTSRPQRSGPFGASWGPDEAFSLVAEYLASQTPAPEAAPVDTTKE